jgi:hypothetical protein
LSEIMKSIDDENEDLGWDENMLKILMKKK